jgi:hypothetical protein
MKKRKRKMKKRRRKEEDVRGGECETMAMRVTF